jgi:hypothetical protein
MSLPRRVPPSVAGSGWKRWLWVFLAVALVCGAFSAVVVPPWQHPDEPLHFEHVSIIAQTGQLPSADYVSLPLRRVIAESMLEHSFWRNIVQPGLDDAALSAVGYTPIGVYTLAQPRLYYLVAAVWLRPWLGLPVEQQLNVVRMLAVALNLGVMCCAFFTSRILFPGRTDLALGVLGFVMFLPTQTDVMSSVNNDALANAFGALFFLALAHIFKRGWSRRGTILGLLSVAGAVLTKTTGLVLVGATLIALVVYPWTGWRGTIRAIGVAIIALCAISVPVMLSPALLGNPLAGDMISRLGQYLRADVVGTWRAMISPEALPLYPRTAAIVFKSFWAVYGWRHVWFPESWYWLPGAAMLLAAIGLVWRSARWVRERGWATGDSGRAGYLALALAAVALAWSLAIVRSQAVQGASLYLSHGRYALVAVAPFALLFSLSVLQWIPAARRSWGLAAYWIALIAFDAAGFWGVFLPYYYG